MFDKNIFALNIFSGLILKFVSMVLIFFVYKEIGDIENIDFISNWLTLYAIVAGLSVMDFGIGSKIKNQFIQDSTFTFNSLNLVYSYLIVGLINCLFFLFLIFNGGITIVNANNWFYFFSCMFFFTYPLLRFSISVIQANKKDWLANISFTCVNILLLVMVVFLGVVEADDIFYYYAIFASFIIPLIFTNFLYIKVIINRSYIEFFDFKKLHLITAKSFLFIQLALFLMNSTNDVLFNMIGDSTLINFQYIYRILSISVIFSTIVSTIIWSNLGRNIYKNLHLVSKPSLAIYFLFILLINFILMVIAVPVIDSFFNIGVIISNTQLLSLAAMTTLLSYIFILSAFLNCLNIIDKQVVFWIIGVTIKISLIFLIDHFIGAFEFLVVFVSIVSFMVISVLYCHCIIRSVNFEKGVNNV